MYDVIIVGSGPAGLSASVYCKRANLSVVVIEKEYEGTGQIAESGQVDNYLGLPGMGGYELGEKFRSHALNLGVDFMEGEVSRIKKGEDGFTLTLSSEEEFRSRTVIYAAGASARRGNISGEDQFFGRGVSYCAICDGSFYSNQTVAVLGGGDTALDDAAYLSNIAKKVYLIHRRDTFRGAAKTVERLQQKDNVEFLLNETVTEIYGDSKVQGCKLSDGTQLEVNGVFVGFGSKPNTDVIRELVSLDANGYVIADETGHTSLDGFFVAGDVRTKPLRQVITAVADGANAATAIYHYLENK